MPEGDGTGPRGNEKAAGKNQAPLSSTGKADRPQGRGKQRGGRGSGKGRGTGQGRGAGRCRNNRR